MADKKRTSKLFQAHPSKLLLDERVSRIVLPMLEGHERFLEEDSEDPLMYSEEVFEEPVEEEQATTLKIFLGVPSLSDIEERDSVLVQEEGHVWDLSGQDYDEFDIFDEDSEEIFADTSLENEPPGIVIQREAIKVVSLGSLDAFDDEEDHTIELATAEPIVGGSLREFLDRPIKEVAVDDSAEYLDDVAVSVVVAATVDDDDSVDHIDDGDWADWEEEEEWNEFSFSSLLADQDIVENPHAEEMEDNIDSILLADPLSDEPEENLAEEEENLEEEEEEENLEEEEGALLPYFDDAILLDEEDEALASWEKDREDEEEEYEATMINIEVEDASSEDPLFPDDSITQESTLLVGVDSDDQLSSKNNVPFDPFSLETHDSYELEVEDSQWRNPTFIMLVLTLIASIILFVAISL